MLRLRPYKDCDAKYIAGWIKTEKIFYQWSAGRYKEYPVKAEHIIDAYAQQMDNDGFFEMTAEDEGKPVGHLIMRFLDEERKILRFGFVVVDDEKRGMGYGKKMLVTALKYAFEILLVDKVTIGVFENNQAAYHCYKSVGFCEAEPAETEKYPIKGEEWKCIYLEINHFPGEISLGENHGIS